MKFCPSTAADIQKYFRNTYVKFTELGEKILFIQKVDTEEVLCVDRDDNAFVVELREDEPYEMNYTLPHRGIFIYGERLFQLRRVPARQWRRGICSENTVITDVLKGTNVPFGFDLLEAFTNKPIYKKLSEWEKNVILLSQRLAVVSNGSIYCDRLRIGTLDKGLARVSPLFIPEVLKVAGTVSVVED